MRARRRLGARTPRAPGTTAKKKYTYSYVHSTSWFVNVSSFVVVVETSKPSLACRVTRRHTALTFGVLSPTTRIAACTSTSISTRVPAQTLANPIARRAYSSTRLVPNFAIQKGTEGYYVLAATFAYVFYKNHEELSFDPDKEVSLVQYRQMVREAVGTWVRKTRERGGGSPFCAPRGSYALQVRPVCTTIRAF